MIRGQLPLVLAVVLIASLTLVEGIFMKDRWRDSDVAAAEFGKRFANVPKQIGPWTGQDMPVDDLVKKTAGAVSYVQREYVHNTTGRTVVLWLIVGHSRDIVRHTPTICYPASGFRQDGALLRQPFDLPDGSRAEFFTAKFDKEDAYTHHKERVFWAWNHPDTRKWEAPHTSSGSENARMHYGLARALYKLYFSSAVMDDESTTDDSAAAKFAQLMLPEINAALFPEEAPADEAEDATVAEETAG
ncbi:MAG: exosortase-associated EpsI family protein [Planctomycetes bacterium]|nr:exosortase-associated EpsI family protein [Planctomycetota bacterium]